MANKDSVGGYFTVERHLMGLTPAEMETILGLPLGFLAEGCRILALIQEPALGQFDQRGSTRYPGADGLSKEELERTNFIPTAWYRQRLMKVTPRYPKRSLEDYPKSSSPVEQWELRGRVPAVEICVLKPGQKYWPNLGRDK